MHRNVPDQDAGVTLERLPGRLRGTARVEPTRDKVRYHAEDEARDAEQAPDVVQAVVLGAEEQLGEEQDVRNRCTIQQLHARDRRVLVRLDQQVVPLHIAHGEEHVLPRRQSKILEPRKARGPVPLLPSQRADENYEKTQVVQKRLECRNIHTLIR
jgi:hypothetical protein